MRLGEQQARQLFAAAPIVFAVDGDTVYTAVDAKPKSTTALRRLANIASNPRVSVLVDHYEQDWTHLWWVRADATAAIVTGARERTGLELLTARYPVYRDQPPPGPVLALEVTGWVGWSAGHSEPDH